MSGVEEQRVVVLGGTGFLGVPTVERALAARREGTEVISVARHPEGRELREVAFDLERTDAVDGLLEDLDPHVVLLLAAVARTDVCESEPDRALRVNTRAPAAVARWCARRERRLVHVSTDLVFSGEAHEGRYREDDPVGPLHVYGRTKARSETEVLAACPRALVVRLPLLAGDSRGTGAGASDSLLGAARAGRVSSLFVDEWRTPLDVDDAARGLLELAEQPVHGLLHLVGPWRLSRFELGHRVLSAAGFSEAEARERIRPVTHDELDLVPPRPRDVSLDGSRALPWLSFEPRSFALPRG